jgi:hypothetical protein
LLTSALRRQPFSVVLFDEVEKAHAEVLDLLLQVLGEGRLTDALGRTADFGNALVILTSNLGVREAESRLGYRQGEMEREAIFLRAAERFFRPEFFNRLDRVLPFHRLEREQVRGIARKLIQDVFAREGLVQRKCLLAVEPDALERIVDQGYDPALGARALKRSIERHLTQPLAGQLAAVPPGEFTAVNVYAGVERLAVHGRPLEQTPELPRPAVDCDDVSGLLRRVRAAMRRIEQQVAPLRPSGPITLGQIEPEAYGYFLLREQMEQLGQTCKELDERAENLRLGRWGLPTYANPDAQRGRSLKAVPDVPNTRILRELAAALDIHEYLRELAEAASELGSGPSTPEVRAMLNDIALLQTITDSLTNPDLGRCVLWLRALNPEPNESLERLCLLYKAHLPALRLEVRAGPALEAASDAGCFLVVDGPHAQAVLRLEVGTHLFCPLHGAVEPISVDVLPLPADVNPVEAVRERLEERRTWLRAVAAGSDTPRALANDPFRLGPVVRIYEERSGVIDLRTGLHGAPASMASFLFAALPLPPEMVGAWGT